MPVPEAVVVLIGSFLLGSIPFGYLMARMRFQTDIRQHGSQNIGATNVARTFGIRVGLVVLVLDALKGILAVMMAFVLFPHSSLLPAASGLMAMLGHVFPRL